MNCLTLLYLCYLARDRFNFSSKSLQLVEIGSELLFHLACITLQQMADPIYSESLDEIEMTFFAILANSLLLNVCSIVDTTVMNKKEARHKKKLEEQKRIILQNLEAVRMRAKLKKYEEAERAANAFEHGAAP
mmetsp:Transcript_37828/g.49716  ORF Transcript_37828/g.49716 Transcript_37828/m.49716 type:complete len:133 (+) Transcript_37828:315-713(+)